MFIGAEKVGCNENIFLHMGRKILFFGVLCSIGRNTQKSIYWRATQSFEYGTQFIGREVRPRPQSWTSHGWLEKIGVTPKKYWFQLVMLSWWDSKLKYLWGGGDATWVLTKDDVKLQPTVFSIENDLYEHAQSLHGDKEVCDSGEIFAHNFHIKSGKVWAQIKPLSSYCHFCRYFILIILPNLFIILFIIT